MKSVIIYFFIVTFVISFGVLEQFDNISEVNQIEKLLNERINIINDFLYGDKDDEVLEKLKKDLSEIEDKNLLESDMSLLTYIYNNPTDYERTTRVRIKEIKNIEITETSIKILANLEWTVLTGEEELPIETSLIKDYNIDCIIKDKKMYLTNMKFVE